MSGFYVLEPPEGVELERTARHVKASEDRTCFHVMRLYR